MNARSYLKQVQSEIPEDKTSSLSTRYISMSDYIVNNSEERQDGCNAKFI